MLIYSASHGRLVYNPIQTDELSYQNIVHEWNQKGLSALIELRDNKPLTFLYLQKIFNGDYTKTRMLNYLFIIANTMLIYHITGRKESFLYPIIPIFLNSMWLTTEIIITFFILVGFILPKYRGILIGLGALFNPFGALYGLLQNRKQIVYMIVIGILFSIVLIGLNLFWPYLDTIVHYGKQANSDWLVNPDWIGMLFIIPMGILSLKNKEMLGYGFIGCLPLIIRPWSHYMIPIYTFFFVGFLISTKRTDK